LLLTGGAALLCIALAIGLAPEWNLIWHRSEAVQAFRDCPSVELHDSSGRLLAKITDRADIAQLWDAFDWQFLYLDKDTVADKSLSRQPVVMFLVYSGNYQGHRFSWMIFIMPNNEVAAFVPLGGSWDKNQMAFMPRYCAVALALAAKYKNSAAQPAAQPTKTTPSPTP
jgi:hypothetical protein